MESAISNEAFKIAADAYGGTVDEDRLRNALEAFVLAYSDDSDWAAMFGPRYSNPEKGANRS